MADQYKEMRRDIFLMIKPLRVCGDDVEWRRAWGASGVEQKCLVPGSKDIPFSVTLKKFPVSEKLTSNGGYELHAHPSLEIGYVLKGRITIYFEDIGEKEYKAGDLIVQPAGLKHAAMAAAEETEILAINIPPAGWEERA